MRNQKRLLIEQLDQKLQKFVEAKQQIPPGRGWIHAIRKALNMTLAQLGNQLGMTRQGVRGIEQSEASGSISLNKLKEVAQAMDLQLVYALVPKDGSLDRLIDRKAHDVAERIVLRTHQNMVLEDQAIEYAQIKKAISELSEEIKREMRKSLWDLTSDIQ